MTARIGADDLELFRGQGLPQVLAAVMGTDPGPDGWHAPFGDRVRSVQRLGLAGPGGGLVVGMWPGELKAQAQHLYQRGRAAAMIARAVERGWIAEPSPQLAFWNSPPEQRLYMRPAIDADRYVSRWEGPDMRRVGRHSREEVERTLWPWLKLRGYADDGDDPVLSEFLEHRLGTRQADLRPGLRLRRHWDRAAVDEAGGAAAMVDVIRADVTAILGAAGERPF